MNPTHLTRRGLMASASVAGATLAIGACSTDDPTSPNPGGDTGAGARPPAPTDFPDEFPAVPKPVPADSYAYDDLSQPVEMTIMNNGPYNGPRPNDPIQKFLEEEFNATISYTSLSADDMRNQLALSFAGGEGLDFVAIPAGLKDVASSLFDQGQLLPADELLDLMPQATSYVTKIFKQWATRDGKMMGIPIYAIQGDIWNLHIRQDFVEKVGIELPTTTDALVDYARALKAKDPTPDKEGPWFMATGGGGSGWQMIGAILNAFGHPRINVVDGKINHPMVDGTTRAFLEFVKQLNDEDLLAPDWYTQKWEGLKSYVQNDQIGMVHYPTDALVAETAAAHDNDIEPAKNWKVMPPITSDRVSEGRLSPPGGPGTLYCFNAKLADDEVKLRRIAHMIDTMVYPNVNYWNCSQGGGPDIWPGEVTVKYDESTGLNVFTIPPTAPYFADPSNTSLADWQSFGYTLRWQTWEDPLGKLGGDGDRYTTELPRWENFEVRLTLDPKPVQDTQALSQRSEINFVLGERPFSEWDAYVQEWLDAGGKKMLDEAAEQLGVATL